MKRYVVHPGRIKSKYDGDIHKIGFRQLTELYGVNPRECIDAEASPHAMMWPPGVIHLYPQSSGDYSLPRS